MILKSQEYSKPEDIAIFVNKNGIKQENIVSITVRMNDAAGAMGLYCIFFYGDPNVKEVTRGMWGW